MRASTEDLHPASAGLQELADSDVLTRLLDGQIHAAEAVRAALPAIAEAARVTARALGAGGRVIYAGAGSSGVMALSDSLELAGTFGTPAGSSPALLAGGAATLLHMANAAEDDEALAAADCARTGFTPDDAVICVAASGRTPYTLAIARASRAAGTPVIGLANVPGARLLAECDVAILLDTGPELVAGSTRMGAATAQKIALNMISTLAGIRMGHVHEGRMVNLTADNSKLRDRAARIVADLSGADAAKARAMIDRSDGAVKPAVLLAAGAADPAHAADLLADAEGHLGPALAALRSETGRDR